jgi:hypothetical protein
MLEGGWGKSFFFCVLWCFLRFGVLIITYDTLGVMDGWLNEKSYINKTRDFESNYEYKCCVLPGNQSCTSDYREDTIRDQSVSQHIYYASTIEVRSRDDYSCL